MGVFEEMKKFEDRFSNQEIHFKITDNGSGEIRVEAMVDASVLSIYHTINALVNEVSDRTETPIEIVLAQIVNDILIKGE